MSLQHGRFQILLVADLVRCSCLFLRDRLPVTKTMSINPSYLHNPAAISGLVTDYRDWQLPLGRRFRALKIWFVLRTYGVSGIQRLVRKHIGLGEYFAGLVRQRRDLFEIVAGPSFALTAIRCILPSASAESEGGEVTAADRSAESEMNGFKAQSANPVSGESNVVTKQVCELINSRGEIFLTGAVIDGIYIIRVVSANELADEKYIKKAFDIIVSTTEEVLAGKDNGIKANGA